MKIYDVLIIGEQGLLVLTLLLRWPKKGLKQPSLKKIKKLAK